MNLIAYKIAEIIRNISVHVQYQLYSLLNFLHFYVALVFATFKLRQFNLKDNINLNLRKLTSITVMNGSYSKHTLIHYEKIYHTRKDRLVS